MSKLFVSEHPLIHTKMAMLRSKETGTKEFREIIGEVASLLFYEATRDLPLTEVAVQTPIAATICKKPVTILGAECVRKSYPKFWETYYKLSNNTIRSNG